MILNLFAIAALLSFLSFSNALFLDSSVHFARHQQIAARRSPVKRSSGSARCKARSPPSASVSPSPVSVSVAVTTPQSISPISSSTPAPSPSSTPSSSTLSSSSSSFGKAGIAWPNGDSPGLENFMTQKVSTIYTWNASPPPDLFGREYCYMLWGGDDATVSNFKNAAQPGLGHCIYGFNEPNLDTQSNLNPADAAQIWMDVILPLTHQGYTEIYTPAVTSAPSGVQWYKDFFEACVGCSFTGMNLHIYATTSAEVINYLTDMYNAFDQKMTIQVTEFACQDFTGGQQCTQDQAFAFMSEVTAWMDKTDFITKYFAYGVMPNININPFDQLMNNDGTPTALGRLYIGS